MATWINFIRTNQGLNLDTKVAAGSTELTITKAMSASGKVNSALLREQTALTNPQQTLALQNKQVIEGENAFILPVKLTNSGLSAGYSMFQLGIFAQDPDLGEILYMICQTSTESGEEIPKATDQPGFSIQWNLKIKISDAGSVTIEVSEVGGITEEQADARYAPINNAALTGIPTAPTASTDTNTTQIATTEFVHTLLDGQTISHLNATLLSTSWTGAEAPYTYDLTLEDITADSDGLITVADTATDEQYQAASAAMLRKTAQAENNLTIKAYGEKPAVDIPITVRLG